MFLVVADERGDSVGAALGHDAGRHRQGVHRAEGVDLPGRPVAADRARHDHVRRRASSRAGTRSTSAATTSARPARRPSRRSLSRSPPRIAYADEVLATGMHVRRVRAPLLVLLHRPLRLSRGGGEVPCGPPTLGEYRARALRGEEARVDAPALPLPDGGLLADGAPAAEQRHPRRGAGARRRLRRRAVAARQRDGRGARDSLRARDEGRRCERSRSCSRSPAWRPRSTRWAARTRSRP